MTQWYYVDNQQQRHGPVDGDVVADLFRAGTLTRTSLVWREGMEQWTALANVAPELRLDLTSPPTPAPAPEAVETVAVAEPEVERPLTGRAVFTASEPSYTQPDVAARVEPVVTSAHSPYAAPRADVGTHAYVAPVANGHVVYAGFWKRVAAYMIDYTITSIIGGVVGMIIGAVMGGLMGFGDESGMVVLQLVSGLIGFAISLVYFSWFQSSSLQATPGKLAIGIKVTRGNGEPMSFLRGVARCFAMILSGLILCIGYVMAGFTERKQGLHDLLCDTLVVDKWAFTPQPERQREELGAVALVVLIVGGLLFAGIMILMVMGFAALASMGR
jgi:uncharacterized RDD family membrane protein YckC